MRGHASAWPADHTFQHLYATNRRLAKRANKTAKPICDKSSQGGLQNSPNLLHCRPSATLNQPGASTMSNRPTHTITISTDEALHIHDQIANQPTFIHYLANCISHAQKTGKPTQMNIIINPTKKD